MLMGFFKWASASLFSLHLFKLSRGPWTTIRRRISFALDRPTLMAATLRFGRPANVCVKLPRFLHAILFRNKLPLSLRPLINTEEVSSDWLGPLRLVNRVMKVKKRNLYT
jgi:hypothetical protein